MLYPSIDKMIQKVDSKYSLVVAASKRARMLSDGTKTEVKTPKSHKNVGVALEEIFHDVISYEKITKEELQNESSAS